MRKIGVQPDPAAVAAAIGPGDPVPRITRRFAVHLDVSLGAELDAGMAHVHRDLLARSATEPPDLAGRECRGRDAGLARRCPRRTRRGGSGRYRSTRPCPARWSAFSASCQRADRTSFACIEAPPRTRGATLRHRPRAVQPSASGFLASIVSPRRLLRNAVTAVSSALSPAIRLIQRLFGPRPQAFEQAAVQIAVEDRRVDVAFAANRRACCRACLATASTALHDVPLGLRLGVEALAVRAAPAPRGWSRPRCGNPWR